MFSLHRYWVSAVVSLAMFGLVYAEPPTVLSVWPDSPPAWDAPEEAENLTKKGGTVAGRPVTRLSNVSNVELHIFEAVDGESAESPVGMVICPGGGFNILAWDLEGLEIARLMQAGGVSVAVLKYRVPTKSMKKPWQPVVQDIQRAIALVRSGKVFSTTPKHVGVMGFSAGGNATVHACIATERQYEQVDAADKNITAPDFACLIYPAWVVEDDNPKKFRDGITVDAKTPPMFLAHADNDPYQVLNSVRLFEELHDAGVQSALHVFSGSGHGFGAREDGRADDLWPELCLRWIRDSGWLPPLSKEAMSLSSGATE